MSDILVIIVIFGGLFAAVLWAVPRIAGSREPKTYMPKGEYDQAQPFEPTESAKVVIDGKASAITFTRMTQERYNDMARREAQFCKDAEKLN